jgi:hypothetical protein
MINQINILLRLLIAHFIADFLLQNEKVINHRKEKKWKSKWLYLHAFIYSLTIYIASSLGDQVFWLIPVVFISHVLIDGFKAKTNDNTKNLLLDQFSHLLVITGIWLIISSKNLSLVYELVRKIWNSSNILLIILGYLLILWPSGYFIKNLTEPFRKQLNGRESRGLEKAGFWIGCLERLLTYSFILSGYAEAIALLVAAKSIFRFGEIKEPGKRQETEYILIGSLLSFGLAMATGYIIKTLMK